MVIDYMQGFVVFNIPASISSRNQHDSFSVIPNNPNLDDPFIVMEWQMKMICYKASNNNPELIDKYFAETDYGKVFEFYVLHCASKING